MPVRELDDYLETCPGAARRAIDSCIGTAAAPVINNLVLRNGSARARASIQSRPLLPAVLRAPRVFTGPATYAAQ